MPAKCVTGAITVTVVTSTILAQPAIGAATVGTTGTPIASLIARDTVNGAPVVLGTGGNGTISTVGTWPTGILLNPLTGAVTTTVAVPVGNYAMSYQLCDRNVPPVCAVASVNVTISANPVAIVAVPASGTAPAGIASTPIANVLAGASINGVAATLGSGGNATLATFGKWPASITLNTATGAVSTSASLPAGTYGLHYKLCDLNAPPDCLSMPVTLVITPPATEVQASSQVFGDIEFDWGRNGVYCPTCNYGQSNARFNWTDKNGNLWIAHLDPTTGLVTPANGTSELADTSAFYYATFNNGPSWAVSTQNGQVTSQLTYTRFVPGTSQASANAGAAIASQSAAGWSASFLPGAIGTTATGATQCPGDPQALVEFADLAATPNAYWEPLTTQSGAAPTLLPPPASGATVSGGKPAFNWVGCTHELVYVVGAAPDALGNVYQQAFWYDVDSQLATQLTTDQVNHAGIYLFRAPEFGGSYAFYTVANNTEIDVYVLSGYTPSGAPAFQIVNRITSPDPAEPYISGTEPFIHCTPQCQTYVFMKLQSSVPGVLPANYVANGIAFAAIDPSRPLFRILVPTAATPTIQRNDIEYYITANGPYLYYSRNTIQSATTQFQYGARYYVDTQLGPPTGPCVGSSAEGGMLPGC